MLTVAVSIAKWCRWQYLWVDTCIRWWIFQQCARLPSACPFLLVSHVPWAMCTMSTAVLASQSFRSPRLTCWLQSRPGFCHSLEQVKAPLNVVSCIQGARTTCQWPCIYILKLYKTNPAGSVLKLLAGGFYYSCWCCRLLKETSAPARHLLPRCIFLEHCSVSEKREEKSLYLFAWCTHYAGWNHFRTQHWAPSQQQKCPLAVLWGQVCRVRVGQPLALLWEEKEAGRGTDLPHWCFYLISKLFPSLM